VIIGSSFRLPRSGRRRGKRGREVKWERKRKGREGRGPPRVG